MLDLVFVARLDFLAHLKAQIGGHASPHDNRDSVEVTKPPVEPVDDPRPVEQRRAVTAPRRSTAPPQS